MRRLIALVVGCALTFVCAPTFSAQYYIDPDKGNDSAVGSVDEPWQHLHHAGRQVKPGDTVFLREGRYVDDYIFTVTDGTEDNPITLTAYREEKPVFTGKGKWEQVLILNNSHYILDGLHFQDTKCLNVVLLNPSSEHSIIRNCTFRNQQSTVIQIRRGGHHVVENCSFDSAGNNEGGGNGDHIYVCGSSHNVIQNNHFVRAGHAVIDVIDFDRTSSTYNIIRDNLIEQHWGGGLYASRLSRFTLFERNTIYHIGAGIDYPKAGFHVASRNVIVRHNIVAETAKEPRAHNAITLSAYRYGGMEQHATDSAIYGNVVYKAALFAMVVGQKNASTNTNNHLLNNVFYRCRTAGPTYQWGPKGNYYFVFETYHANRDNKWKSFPNGNFFHHNLILHADDDGDHPGEDPMFFYEQEQWAHSLAWVQENYPNHFYANAEVPPRFVAPADRNFALQPGSGCIDAGGFLTRTTAAGNDTTVIPVERALFFCDGWGVDAGDMIRVGDNTPVRLVSADYDANVLTLKTPVTCAAGDPVSLPWKGNAPDIGAFEWVAIE